MRTTWNNTVIAESDNTVRVEGNHYFPEHKLKREYVTFSNPGVFCRTPGLRVRFQNGMIWPMPSA